MMVVVLLNCACILVHLQIWLYQCRLNKLNIFSLSSYVAVSMIKSWKLNSMYSHIFFRQLFIGSTIRCRCAYRWLWTRSSSIDWKNLPTTCRSGESIKKWDVSLTMTSPFFRLLAVRSLSSCTIKKQLFTS